MLCVNPFTAVGLLEGVPAGATVVLNAANSAISGLILAVCQQRRIPCVAVVRSESAAAALRDRAAAVVVDGPDLSAQVKAAAPSKVLWGLDAVAGEASGRMFDALDEGATLIVYGLLSDTQVHLPAAGIVFRGVVVRGFSRLRGYRAMSRERREEITAELVTLLQRGTLKSEVGARFALADVKAALTAHEQPGRQGKILLLSDP
jgi:mitochondrial enoyl-[acyl-carrier protein] reductase / trans-2-enoyl-CoA reductase